MNSLAFVSPKVVLPKIIDQLRIDIDPSTINALTEDEFGVLETPEGTMYVDGELMNHVSYVTLIVFLIVLSSQKSEEGPKKGKDADIARWEAELRKSLANKKGAASAALSKQAQALVQAQLDKEAIIRQRVATIKLNLRRGLSYVQSLSAIDVPELRMHVSFIVSLLLEGAMGRGSRLVGSQALEAYLVGLRGYLLRSLHLFFGVRTSQSAAQHGWTCSVNGLVWRRCEALVSRQYPRNYRLNDSAVRFVYLENEIHAKNFVALVLRVLYRLRSLSEQAPFDAATFSFASPLLVQVLLKGGVDVGEDGGDDVLEQITLVLDIIKFHCNECWSLLQEID